MRKNLKKFIFLFFCTLTFQIYASKLDVDTSFIESPKISDEFEASLDSLLNQWYLQNSQIEESFFIDSIDNDSIVLQTSITPDSLYIARLKALPFEIPLTYNKITRNFIELYLYRKRDKLQSILGLSEYYFPIMNDIIDQYDIPKELIYISVIESALNPKATSRARAVGLWQFIYGTGRLYGMTMNSLIDERRDPITATHSACRFFRDLYAIYGDWHLCIAAYNCGPNNVKKAIRRSGGKRNFWEIYRYLPRETRGYVPAFIGASYAMAYYKEHNITPIPATLPMYTDTLMIYQDVHFGQIAQLIGLPIEQIRTLNPQYIRDIVPARLGNAYPLRLPIDYISKYIDNEESIYAHKDSVFFNVDYLKSPSSYASSGIVPGRNYTKIYHKVKQGDYLGSIAQHYNCRVNDIKDWNNIYRNKIRVGQRLVIYIPKKKASKFKAELGIEKSNTQSTNSSGEYIEYTVKSGDTLWGISQKFSGASDEEIRRLNNIGSYETIKPGQRLKIMKKSSVNN